MNWPKTMEARLESWWENLGKRGSKAKIEPVEIAKKLVHEMAGKKKVSVKRVYVPNRYLVCLSPPDWDTLSAVEQALAEELASYLEEKAAERGFTLVGRPRIKLEQEDQLPQGRVKVHGWFSQEDRMEKIESDSTMPLQLEPHLTVKVIKGPDAGQAFPLANGEAVIGRRATCHIVLSDANVSRQHAVIQRHTGGGHCLLDLGSTNGTFINGQKIERKLLRVGDRIALGDSELEIEVS